MITLTSLAFSPVIYLSVVSGLIGLGFSFWNYKKVSSNKLENDKTEFISSNIKEGVKTLKNSRLLLLGLFAVLIGLLMYFFYGAERDLNIPISFIIGAISAVSAAYVSKYIATYSGEFVTSETAKSYKAGFKTAFNASIASGLSNVSIFVLGISVNMLLMSLLGVDIADALLVFIAFMAGVAIVSVLNRLSGALLNQSAEIAEDELIKKHGKITAKSLFNPASVLKSVGRLSSNVGGISSDVFDTLSIAVIAAILAKFGMNTESFVETDILILLPLVIISIGVLTGIIGSFFLNSNKPSNSKLAIKLAEGVSAAVLVLVTFFAIKFMLPTEWTCIKTEDTVTTYYSLGIFWSALIGVAASLGVGYINDSFSDYKRQAAKEIAGQSMKGLASNNLSTMRMSFISTGAPILLMIGVGLASYYFANFYGLAIATVAFVSNIALQQSFGAFAAITETSRNIASKSYLNSETINNASLLKKEGAVALSNLQMFLLVAASLSAVAVFSFFVDNSALKHVDISQPLMFSSLAVGALIPILLSYNTIGAIKRLSRRIVREAEGQFNESISLEEANAILLKYEGNLTFATEGEKESVYRAKAAINNKKSVKEAANMSFYEVLAPVGITVAAIALFGFLGGSEVVSSLLTGFVFSSVILAAYSIMKGTLSESARNTVQNGFVYKGEIVEKASIAYAVAVSSDKSNKTLKSVLAPTLIMLVKIAIVVSMVLFPIINSGIKSTKTIHIDRLSYTKTDANSTNN